MEEWAEEKASRGRTRLLTLLALAPALLPALPVLRALVLLALAVLLTGDRPYWLYVTARTFTRDARIIFGKTRLSLQLRRWQQQRMTVRKRLQQLTEEHPNKVAFYTEERPWTYLELSQLSNKLSRVLLDAGAERGRCVAVLLGAAGARLPAAWLGLAALGAPAALLPPAARGAALLHAIAAARASTLLYSSLLCDAVQEIAGELEGVTLLQWELPGAPRQLLPGARAVLPLLEVASSAPLEAHIEAGNPRDSLIYIYTSGTTGLPKAAIVTNTRYMLVTRAATEMTRLGADDVLYSPMPLHHTAGGVLGAGQALVSGVTVVLRAKFSASNFWADCVKYRCTAAQYIGEMCRFLLSAQQRSGRPTPPHDVRLLLGNGLRASLWRSFQDTFRVPEIYEFYGATEGNTNMINITSQEGAVGFIPRLLSFLAPITLIKFDQATGEPIRNAKGLCIKCSPGEEGLLVGRVQQKQVIYSFQGYVDEKATARKLLHDVFKRGDCYFNSGDLLVMDHMGYYYFRDRTGDTFRWRGENVSTTEVEGVISSITHIDYVMVYGVKIPDIEGRAGMAALVCTEAPASLSQLKNTLPPFARPLFLRLLPTPPLTATHKLIKTQLREEGYDLSKVKDPLLFLDPATDQYVSLTQQLYEDIVSGKVRM